MRKSIMAIRKPTRSVLLVATAIAALGGAACYWLLLGKTPEAVRVAEATCHIVFFSREERLRPPPPPSFPDDLHIIVGPAVPPIPREQGDNPVLLYDRFAFARFENTTSHPLMLYAFSDTLLCQRRLRDTVHLVVEVRDADGNVLEGTETDPELMFRCSSNPPQGPPPAAELLARKTPAFVLQPGEWIDLPMSILGNVTRRSRGLKPGTYTVRATISYAEAPSGETKQVMSEPVLVTVTEEHIKADEDYWTTYLNRPRPKSNDDE